MGVDEKALGQRLQKARQRAGLTQQELCQKAGLSYSTLAKIERGAIKAPSIFTVAAIVAATGATFEKLLDIKLGNADANSDKKVSKTGVKFVYFDLNNTVVRSYEKAFTKLAEESGKSLDAVEATYWRYNNPVCAGEMSMSSFNNYLSEQLGLSDVDWTQYYLNAVESTPGMDALVDWASQYYEVGLLSGTMPGLIAGLAKEGKINLTKFNKVIDSSEVGCLKADHRIFKLAQKASGVAANEILLVDDDRLALINADELGWQISAFNPYDPEESIARVKAHLEF